MTLAAWARHVQVARDFTKRQIPTIAADVRVILAIDQELAILRASNEFLRQQKEG